MTRVLTIGASCINRFQFEFFCKRRPDIRSSFAKSFFDWNITSLDATETVLRLAGSGDLLNVLRDATRYFVEYNRLIFHSDLPGFCFYHEKEIAEGFEDPAQVDLLVSKLEHQAAPFLSRKPDAHTHLIWSNIQPNLPATVGGFMEWKTFVLTEQRYDTVKRLATDLFGPKTTFSFLAAAGDHAPELASRDDVHPFDLPRGDTFRGDPFLYDPLLTKVLGSKTV